MTSSANQPYALFPILSPWPSRGVPDVQDSDRIADNSVEHLERITDERKDVHAGPLLNARRTFRRLADLIDNVSDAQRKRRGNPVTKFLAALSGYLAQIADRAVGEFDLHLGRNERKAASTSCSLAMPLRSASSKDFNSSAVAR